jgi:hypothetical protein
MPERQWKVGDKIVRIYVSIYNNGRRVVSEETRFEGKIIEVKEKTVVALILVDIMREMEFFKDTGINVLGQNFGRIVHAK